MAKMKTGTALSGPAAAVLSLERREFLKLGSAALVTLAAGDLFAETLRPVATVELPSELSVAWVGGAIDSAMNANSPGLRLLPVQSVTAGDPRFLSRTARITILGMWRPEDRRKDPMSVTMKTWYPTSLYLGGDVPFYAWNQVNRGVHDTPRQARFRIPIDEAGLRLEMEASIPVTPSAVIANLRNRVAAPAAPVIAPLARAAIASQPNVATLSLGIERDSPKLNPGTYVLALLPAGAQIPDWQSVRYAPWDLKSDNGPVSVMEILGKSSAPFDYVVFDVAFGPN